MKTLKEWAEAHGVTFVGRSAGVYTTGTVSAAALEEIFAAAAALRRERDELKSDLAESDAVRDQLADLLHRTAIAVRGPEPELTRWSWHDVPDRVAAAIAALGGAVQAAAEAMRERDELAARLAKIEAQVVSAMTREDAALLCEEVSSDLIAAMMRQGVDQDEARSLTAAARLCASEIRAGYVAARETAAPAAAPEQAEPCRTCGPDGCSDSTSCPRGER